LCYLLPCPREAPNSNPRTAFLPHNSVRAQLGAETVMNLKRNDHSCKKPPQHHSNITHTVTKKPTKNHQNTFPTSPPPLSERPQKQSKPKPPLISS
jgi:hypothetical protein